MITIKEYKEAKEESKETKGVKKMNDNTTLKIEFEENLSNSSIEMIKKILWDSMGFKTKIEELEEC